MRNSGRYGTFSALNDRTGTAYCSCFRLPPVSFNHRMNTQCNQLGTEKDAHPYGRKHGEGNLHVHHHARGGLLAATVAVAAGRPRLPAWLHVP
jgi:hypothetical protein